MPALSPVDVAPLLDDPATIKVLAVPGPDDAPRLVPVPSLHRGEGDRLVLLESHESSESHRGLLRALWFDKAVALLLTHPDGRAVEIAARPDKAHVTGPLFLRHYQARLAEGNALSTVWELAPGQATDQSERARAEREALRHPDFIHLDRIAV